MSTVNVKCLASYINSGHSLIKKCSRSYHSLLCVRFLLWY